MIERRINLPTLGLIAATRVALGVGAGLLLADRLDSEQRRACGLALFTVGALSTIPLAIQVLSSGDERQPSRSRRVSTRGRRELAARHA